ncbi:hypothetical protein AB0I66_16365 [Streptomyces sp. NPDC050439]|uniref:hypothetical protein n=1 Tax=unclassified Streptomyces TaxID=2593676 RepID=UPI00343C7C1D
MSAMTHASAADVLTLGESMVAAIGLAQLGHTARWTGADGGDLTALPKRAARFVAVTEAGR